MALEVNVKRHLKGFDLDVSFETGEDAMGLLGASGSGKSMTLRTIAGIDTPDEGRIVLNGRVLFDSEKKINLKPQERRVGYLFQNYALFPTMTVEQNIGVALKVSKEEKEARVAEMVEKYQLKGLEKRMPHQLSGGQQQRVALARMRIMDPELILLDEPFSALDAFLRETMLQELLAMIKEYDGDVILVSHSRDDIYKCCENLTVIHEGRSIMQGRTADIFLDPQTVEACRLTGCKNISRARKTGKYELFAEDWNCTLTTALPVRDDIRAVGIRGHYLKKGKAGDENALSVRLTSLVEAPFEHQYLVRPKDAAEAIWWMVPRDAEEKPEEDFEGYILLPPDRLMQLK